MIMKELEDMEGFRISGTVVHNIRRRYCYLIERTIATLLNVVVAKCEEKGLHLNSIIFILFSFTTDYVLC